MVMRPFPKPSKKDENLTATAAFLAVAHYETDIGVISQMMDLRPKPTKEYDTCEHGETNITDGVTWCSWCGETIYTEPEPDEFDLIKRLSDQYRANKQEIENGLR
jgi:hypothetical protein